ncbi:hypothetical protein BRX37_14025 [Sphingomonas sp. S-NIH.Pt3_0716]|nr:hypothetical protein BRX37_14025 [Sphingomonas sp. S-NIH.Pt3_0716]
MHIYSAADLESAKEQISKHILADPVGAGMTIFIHNPSRQLVRRVLEMPPSEAGISIGRNDTIATACFATIPAWLNDGQRKSIKVKMAHRGRNYRCHILDACFDYVTVKEAEAATADMAHAA